jgi:hypothetical protein
MSVDGFGGGSVKAHVNAGADKLHAGLKNKSPKFPDASMGTKGGSSVSADATRSSVAATPKTLGPRVA